MSNRKQQTRTASRTPARRRRFKIVVEAQEMLVDYTANWMGGDDPIGHFEFRNPHEPPRRIPVSETGYKSHFAPMEAVEAEASSQARSNETPGFHA